MDIPGLQRALSDQKLDGWLLYDFRGQNPTAQSALGLGGHMLTRRWFYLVPARGEPRLLVHAIELGSFPREVPGARESYTSWQSLRSGLERLLSVLPPSPRLAMEYCPMAAIPYLSRVDAGTVELVRALGAEVHSSAELVQRFLCRWSPHQLASHVRALRAIDDAKDAAFAYVGDQQRRGLEPTETQVQAFLMKRFADAGLETDHPPIVAVNAHAGDPHYAPSERTSQPVRRGDLLLIDLWAREKGPDRVYADITWVGFCGDHPPARLEEIFRVAAEARDLGLRTVEEAWRAGRVLQGWEVDRRVRDHVASKGYGERFLHPPATPSAPRSTETAPTSTTSRPTTPASWSRGSPSPSSRGSTCRRRGSAFAARSTSCSPPRGRRSSPRSSRRSCASARDRS